MDWKKYYQEIAELHIQGKGSHLIYDYLKSNYIEFKEVSDETGKRYIRKLIKEEHRRPAFAKILKKLKKSKTAAEIFSDKKPNEKPDLWEILEEGKRRQKIQKQVSQSQSELKVKIDSDKPICVMVLGDTQLGSFGTDYDTFKRITEEIIEIPNLYVILVGDIIQLAINLRGVAEVLDNMFAPEIQYLMLEQWIDLIKHKVIAATWCNHGTMREEKVTGFSYSAKILSDRVPFFSGIGHIDLTVGEQTYKIAATHFFQGKSMYNKAHAPMRYMREKANDREITIQGDFHQPGILWQPYGGMERLGIVCGSIQKDSGYAKRFFSLKTFDHMPCFTLHPKEHLFNPYPSVKHWLNR